MYINNFISQSIFGFLLIFIPFLSFGQKPGSLDLDFGKAGNVVTDIPVGFLNASGMLIQPDGKIIAMGSSLNIVPIAITRYKYDGNLDSSFAKNGIYTESNFGTTGVTFSDIWSSAIQSDAKILIAGTLQSSFETQHYILRLNENGTKDASFGTNGFVRINIVNLFEPFGSSVAICALPDKKLMVLTCEKANKFTLIRLNENGTYDNTFGTNGIVEFGTSATNTFDLRATSIHCLPDNKLILYAHSKTTSSSYSQCHLLRLMSDGTKDLTFGNNGEFIGAGSAFDTAKRSIAFQPDGKIVRLEASKVFRLNQNGTPDNSFVTTALAPTFSNITTQADGKIILTGLFSGQGIVLRLEKDGAIDFPFGSSNGYYYSPAAAIFGFCEQEASGKLIAFGTKSGDFVLSRLYAQNLSSLEEPKSSVLMNIYPNPVKTGCTLDFELKEDLAFKVFILDLEGRLIKTLVEHSDYATGRQQLTLNLSTLTPGVYFVQIKGENWQETSVLYKI